jgi:DNA-binding phage protein
VVNFLEQKNGGYHSNEIMSNDRDKVLKWLRDNKSRLSISGIANEAGMSITQLHKAISEGTDGHGTIVKIPEKHLPKLMAIIKDMKF